MTQLKLGSALLLLTLAATLCCYNGAASSQSRPVRFGSFNIQVYGRKKASDAAVMDALTRILSRYDIVVVMEIRDSSNEAFNRLVSQLNSNQGGDRFAYVISERTGRSVSKEQYAVLYRRSVAEVLSERTVPDPGDRFQREPYVVDLNLKARRGGRTVPLTLACLHTEPDNTVAELEALYDIATQMRSKNLLIAGDLNADCSYVSKTEMSRLKLRKDAGFHWLIDDAADTTVKGTNCAYDRLIVTDSAMRLLPTPSARVFLFDKEFGLTVDEAVRVSYHYPVELDIEV